MNFQSYLESHEGTRNLIVTESRLFAKDRFGKFNETTTHATLELELDKNIFAIAPHHLGDPERAANYFNQSLLEDPTRSEPDMVTPKTEG